MQILAAPELLVTIRATAGSVVSPTTSTHPRASHSPHRRSSVMVPGQLRNRSGMFGPMDAVLQAISDASRRTVMETLRVGPATVGELAALLPIARPGCRGIFGCSGRRDSWTCAKKRNAGSTACGPNRLPQWTNGWGATGSCGKTGWTP